jgi:hypothetical protein
MNQDGTTLKPRRSTAAVWLLFLPGFFPAVWLANLTSWHLSDQALTLTMSRNPRRTLIDLSVAQLSIKSGNMESSGGKGKKTGLERLMLLASKIEELKAEISLH